MKKNDIIIICEHLGNIYGYFQGLHGAARIHINAALDAETKNKVIAAGKAAADADKEFEWLRPL